MRIVVNHVTRMTAPRICVAGVDTDSFEHVRPTTSADDPLTRDLLRENGGPFGIGAVVDLGRTVPTPNPPEIEDHRFTSPNARFVEQMDGDEFLTLLEMICHADLRNAFGPALEHRGRNYAALRGQGACSLAVVRAGRRPHLEVDRFGKLRLQIDDGGPEANVPVTDVRFYEDDQRTLRNRLVQSVSLRLRRGVGAFLMLGLARAYRARDDDHERHWLQLNGICLIDRPVGEIP